MIEIIFLVEKIMTNLRYKNFGNFYNSQGQEKPAKHGKFYLENFVGTLNIVVG